MIKKIFSSTLVVAISLATLGIGPLVASAGSLTAMSDTMSRQKASTASSNVVKFTTPTAINDAGGGNTIVITFPSDFNFTGSVIGDLTFTHGATTGAETTETLAASPSASAWGAVFSGTQLRVLTLTAPTDGVGAASLIANDKVIVTYASTHEINPSTSGSKTITITTATGAGNTGSDTGSLAIAIVAGSAADEDEVITATVAPTITFTNDDAAIGFGTLSSGAVTYANGAATGTGSDSAAAHTLVITTNATSGYTLSYNGPTLTSGGNTITAATSIGTGGTPGSEQFAMSTVLTGTGTVTAAYNHGTPLWSFVPSTTTTLATSTGPSTSSSFDMRYEANISASTEAGLYTSTVTYLASGGF